MYCAGCGSQIQSGLNYCSRCGRRVADEAASSKPAWIHPLAIVGQTAGVGFVSFIFILLILAKNGVTPNIFVPITFFYFAALFGICFMILKMGMTSEKVESVTPASDETPAPAYLRPVTTAQLEEARDSEIGSVTDATTRTLDKVPAKDR